MLKFIIGQTKRITIQRLTSEPVNENWKYQWYACKTRKCDDIDIFYSVTDRNGNNVLNEWVSDSFVDYNFFEITSPAESFWIFVNVDKNDGCDICLYELQIKVNDGIEPEIEVDLSELDCLDINASLENELIVGKVFAKNTPKLQQIRLSVPLNNSIEFSSSNKLLFNTNLIEVSDVDDIIEYKFEFRINIINHGAGSIKTSFISQEGITLSETITYNFFIIPNLFKLFNLNTTIYEIKTTLPFTCSSNIIGQNDTNAPEVFINDETITTILDLRLFGTFLSEFEFIYSVAKVFSPNFCYSNDINLIPNSAFEEVIKIKGNETNGISYTFIATLSSQQLNYLPRPFTIVVRLEVRKIKDIYCSNLGNNTANLRGWTILPASTICDTIIPHKNPSLSNPPEYKWCDCCKDCGDDPICLSKCASNPENYKFLVEASIPCESICFHNCECWDSLGIDPDISTDRHYYNLHITSECNEPYHKDCPECFRYCLDCPNNCGGHNDCVGDCYRGEYRQCVDNCEDDLNCIEKCKKEYYLVPCKNYQHNCDNLPCEKECPGEEERIPCEQECCTKPCPCPTGCINYLEGKEIPCTSECPSCMQVCSCGETDIPCGEACPSCKWCILSCCGLEVARFKNRIPSNSEIDFLINNDRRCRTWNCTNITLECVTNHPPPLEYDLICCDEKVDSFEWIGNVLTCQEYIGYEDCNTIICDNNGNCEKRNEEETHYGEVIFKFERVPVSVEIIVNIVNSMVHEKLPVNVIESDNSLYITTFNGNNINEINDLGCGLDYTIEFEKLNCYEFVDSSNDLGLIIPDDLGKFVFPAPNKNGIIEFNYKLKEVVVTIIFEFEDDFEHCGTDENITNIKDVVIITGFITNVLDEQENWELDSYDESSVTYIKTNVGCGNEVQVGFDIDCNCYEFVDSISDNFGIDGGLENGLENYIFKPFEDGIIVFKFKRKEINIKIEIIRGDE